MNGSHAKQPPWWKRLLAPATTSEPERPAPTGAAGPTGLDSMLAPRGLVVWEDPVPREEVVRTLVDCVAPQVPGLTASDALRHLRERDALGSTSVGEGVDIPHARIEGVSRPVFAIGLTRGGLTGGPEATDTIEVVWLLLLPPGGSGLAPTAQVARACRDPVFRTALRNAQSTEAARSALSRWERTHEAPSGHWSA